MGWHMVSGNAELSTNVIRHNLNKAIWFSGILLLPAYIIILPHWSESLASQYLVIWAIDKVVMHVHHGLWEETPSVTWSVFECLFTAQRVMILPIRRDSKESDDMASFSRSCCWVSYIDWSASRLGIIVTMNMFSGDNVERRFEIENQVLVVPTRHPCLMIPYCSRLNATWLVHQALVNVG